MIRALYTAASGMTAQQMNLDTIANNLANSSTTGFRQLRLQFQDMIYQNLITPGAAQSQSTVSAGLQIGLGTKSAATEVIMTQGALNQTSNPLDLAIEGPGFFQVDMVVAKRFALSPAGANVEIRGEVYNLFNRNNYDVPPATLPNALGTGTNQLQPNQPFNAAVAGSGFGKLRSTVGTTVGMGTNRQAQFALRLNF